MRVNSSLKRNKVLHLRQALDTLIDMGNINIPEDKFNELISGVLAVRAAHQIQAGVVSALLAAIDAAAPGAVARVEAAERDQELEELHQRSAYRK